MGDQLHGRAVGEGAHERLPEDDRAEPRDDAELAPGPLPTRIRFLALSALSVYIGSTTKRAEMRIYQERVAALTAQGATTLPAAPEIYTLTILSNLTEYVAIVGAILAVILGYNALIDEKESGGLCADPDAPGLPG